MKAEDIQPDRDHIPPANNLFLIRITYQKNDRYHYPCDNDYNNDTYRGAYIKGSG